jgi:Ca-activated chloride channel family protein
VAFRSLTLRLHQWRRLAPVATALLFLPMMTAMTAQQPPASPAAQPAIRFRSGIDIVRLSVTARDAGGQLVHDLGPEEFEVYEDGVRQKTGPVGHHETPISVVLLLDRSGSMMQGDKIMHAKDGAINFVNALKPGDEALVIAFSDHIDALGRFGLDAKTIVRAVKRVDAEAGTRLYDAVIEGARAIADPGRKEKRAIVILSDGADTASLARLDEAVEAVRIAEAPVYAIAIEYGDARSPGRSRTTTDDPLWRQLRNSSALDPLHRLTDGTGGWTYSIEASKRCTEICIRIADELRNQYLLGYYPTNTERDGRWRSIKVRTTRSGITLATRTGYYAPRT